VKIRRERWTTIVIAAIAITSVYLVSHLLGSIDIKQALHDVSHELGTWTYALVGLAAFVETGAFVGLILPGETVVILGGAVAGQGATSVEITIAVVWICAWGGDSVSFLLGRKLGRGFVLRHGPKVRITEERFRKVESYFERYGGRTIVIGRFIGLVRALAPFSAGSSGMRYRAFLPYSVLGTGLWAAAFTLVGYFASQSIDKAAAVAGRSTFYLGLTAGVVAAVVIAVRFLRVEENRERAVQAMESNAALRPLLSLGRRLVPHARFAWARLTPGELGLELTALLATLAVGAFVLVAYAITVSGHPGPTGGDVTAFDAASNLRADWLTSVAKVFTAAGSAAVILPVALIAGAWLGIKRRWVELAILVAGVALTFIGVGAIKAAVDRPRPSGALIGIEGSSYPSGHAAHAMLYPALAFLLTARAKLRPATLTVVHVSAFALAAIVGLTRVYLRAHFLSDVSGGWGLGASAFALAATVAMVVSHLRQNPARDGAAGEPSD
jgi:membrane protein DedA with SNARE-associated domain/membrane-associated phospholipid phosphatase